MKKLIIILCLLFSAIIGYQAYALTISSGSLSIKSGTLSVFFPSTSDTVLWDASDDVVYWDISDDNVFWD